MYIEINDNEMRLLARLLRKEKRDLPDPLSILDENASDWERRLFGDGFNDACAAIYDVDQLIEKLERVREGDQIERSGVLTFYTQPDGSLILNATDWGDGGFSLIKRRRQFHRDLDPDEDMPF